MIAYTIWQCSRGFTSSLTTLRTQEITEYEFCELDGYIFRNEQVIRTDYPSVTEYMARDGEKVGVGDTVAYMYHADGKTAQTINEIQEQLNAISQQIAVLAVGNRGESGLAGAEDAKKRSDRAYLDALANVSDGDFHAAAKNGSGLLEQISRYRIITGQMESAVSISDHLKQKRSLILSGLNGNSEPLVCERAGYFSSSVDGYEELFDKNKLTGMTADDIIRLTGTGAKTDENGFVVGKMIYGPEWNLVLPADLTDCTKIEPGRIYSVTFSDNEDITLQMYAESVIQPESTDGTGVIILSSDMIPGIFTFRRLQSVRITTGETSGYRIPEEAITENNGYKGVYILDGSFVDFRRISIEKTYKGYVIASDYESCITEDPDTKVAYLDKNDLIITAGSNLYVGKIYY